MIGAGNDTEVAWIADGEGISITVPVALASAGKYCWAFKIEYSEFKGTTPMLPPNSNLDSELAQSLSL